MKIYNNQLTIISFTLFFLVLTTTQQDPSQPNSGTAYTIPQPNQQNQPNPQPPQSETPKPTNQVDPQIVPQNPPPPSAAANTEQSNSAQPVIVQPDTIAPIVVEPLKATDAPQQPQVQVPVATIDPVVAPTAPEQASQQGGYQRNIASQQVPSASDLNQPPRNPSQQQNTVGYDESSEARSARYRAEQEKLQQMRRQQEREQQRQTYRNQKQLRTINRKATQRNQVRDHLIPDTYIPTPKNVLFEIDRRIEEYVINPMEDREMSFKMMIYTLENNAYGVIKDIDTAGALKVYVYEDNSQIVAQAEFYFEKVLKFKVKAKSTYNIRFYNDGIPKLLSFNYPNLLESSHIEDLYSNEKRHLHLWKTEVLSLRMTEVTEKLRLNAMMDRVNNQTMMDFLMKYSGYQFFEILAVLLVTAFQVHLIKKLFRTDSIL